MHPPSAADTRPQLSGDGLTLLRAWLAAPSSIGAQWPSGPRLARAMAIAADLQRPGRVVELGPGTGPVTRALLAQGVPPHRLLLVENNAEFCDALRRRHQGVEVIQGDAFGLPRERRVLGSNEPIATVVSSLPLLHWPPSARAGLVRDWLSLTGADGRFIQFSYAFASPVPQQPDLATRRVSRVWRNVWPAQVWSYTRPSVAKSPVLSPGTPAGAGSSCG